jgi:hypothetical protein
MIGSKVVVQIEDYERYAFGAAAALDGMKGTVVSRHEGHLDPVWLVEFDQPAPTWWKHQTPATAFWFPEGELVELSRAE